MQGARFTVAVHLGGTLAANQQGVIQLPCAATLIEVSACGSNSNSATLQLGTTTDVDGIMAAAAIGDSSVPAVFAAEDFDGDLADGVNPLHLADDTVVAWLLDYDGSSGTAAQNVDILFTFLEG
ncbi:MAG: hypothetical protein QM346_18365 [Chloroflexota bacterium]|nr:hypothetical protein [Chloroflexota bacterium]